MDGIEHAYDEASGDLQAVLDSAAKLQELVPDAVLVGGSAAALYAGHQDSYDHGHVVAGLRDRFDVAALSARYGTERAAAILSGIDEYYADQRSEDEGVRSQLVRQLSEPRPADFAVTAELSAYRNLSERWTDWSNVVAACRTLAAQIARG